MHATMQGLGCPNQVKLVHGDLILSGFVVYKQTAHGVPSHTPLLSACKPVPANIASLGYATGGKYCTPNAQLVPGKPCTVACAPGYTVRVLAVS